ncbi:hypothetical protein SLEP1_g27535 [Rubroshorea leprosula]|uniref:S-adenosyl-L-methionine-dependent methyltransferase superfamily protein n=1 Tax=Rubroshorea leprosula TaxID=152421 RepID=A0AAV5K3C7_9ROSI|nr:hypothetical protein SLEP1_g27535 [Rubroshorea leprosula]
MTRKRKPTEKCRDRKLANPGNALRAAPLLFSVPFVLRSLHNQISGLQSQVGILLERLHTESSESKVLAKFSNQVLQIAISLDKLADGLSGLHGSSVPPFSNELSSIHEDVIDTEETDDQEGSIQGMVLSSGELRNYASLKPSRLSGKKSFLGVESINPSIGLACTRMASNVDRFMSYKIYDICPDDWDIAQKLILNGCDPLPRRRCFSRTPLRYTKPFPVNSSLWRGFFKCASCFDLSKRGWEVQEKESTTAEFTIDEVLRLKPGEIRIGLDFSPTTGTFAALMRERNVTIASATLNLGAPFNEVIALRGLLPLYVSVGSRLPFFDNTLDIIHSTMFLDGWIGIELLQFVLFDWDWILRPKGILWVDRFFCKKDDMKLYLEEFSRLGYRKLLWRVVPKTDKLEDELFFSAVLEKPVRG